MCGMDLLVLCGRRPLPSEIRCVCSVVLAVAHTYRLPAALLIADAHTIFFQALSLLFALWL